MKSRSSLKYKEKSVGSSTGASSNFSKFVAPNDFVIDTLASTDKVIAGKTADVEMGIVETEKTVESMR